MGGRSPKKNLIPIAWAVGWALASSGMMISDVYSSPNRGLGAYYLLGLAGWAIGAGVTIAYVHRHYGGGGYVIVLRITGWGLGALIALVIGFSWGQRINGGYWGPILASALGAAIGSALTFPVQPSSSIVRIALASLLSAFSWGVAFLVFQTLAFYAGYLLSALMVYRLSPIMGYSWWIELPGWVVPAGICGLLAAQFASITLRLTDNVQDVSPID